MSVRKLLQKLQGVVTSQSRDAELAGSFRVPAEYESILGRCVSYSTAASDLLGRLHVEIASDFGLEHLTQQQVENELFRFICSCKADPRTRAADIFLERNLREVEEKEAWYAINHLEVEGLLTQDGVRIVPVEQALRDAVGVDRWDQRAKSLALVTVRGSNQARMIERGLAEVRDALAGLRVRLRERGCSPELLRFQFGHLAGIRRHESTWTWHHVDALNLTLSHEAIERLDALPVPTGKPGLTDAGRRLRTALEWIDRAYLTDDLVVRVVFQLTALEAILGSKDDRLKAQVLAFTGALLTAAAVGEFSHPNRIYFMYEDVRSTAVHGSETPPLDKQDVQSLERHVNELIAIYARLVAEHGFQTRKQLLRWVEQQVDVEVLLAQLAELAPESWLGFTWPSKQ